MYQKKSDDAISPVIGVMLMLVVTIVIAAVVVAFSTGMVSETNAVAPAAAFDVEIYSSFNDIVPSMHITHVSGDPVDTADMKLTFTWECPYPTCPSGVGHVHSSSYEFVDDGRWGYYDGRGGTDCDGIPFGVEGAKETSGYFGSTVQPLYINHGLGANVEYDDGYNYDGAYFGYITLKRGMTVYAYEQHLPKGDGNPAMDILLNNGDILVEPVEADSGHRLRLFFKMQRNRHQKHALRTHQPRHPPGRHPCGKIPSEEVRNAVYLRASLRNKRHDEVALRYRRNPRNGTVQGIYRFRRKSVETAV